MTTKTLSDKIKSSSPEDFFVEVQYIKIFIAKLRKKFKAFSRTDDADVVDAIIDKLAEENLI